MTYFDIPIWSGVGGATFQLTDPPDSLWFPPVMGVIMAGRSSWRRRTASLCDLWTVAAGRTSVPEMTRDLLLLIHVREHGGRLRVWRRPVGGAHKYLDGRRHVNMAEIGRTGSPATAIFVVGSVPKVATAHSRYFAGLVRTSERMAAILVCQPLAHNYQSRDLEWLPVQIANQFVSASESRRKSKTGHQAAP